MLSNDTVKRASLEIDDSPRRGALALIVAFTMVAGCSVPVEFSGGPYVFRDDRTEYAVQDTPTGFIVIVRWSAYQFVPDFRAVIQECRSALTSLAHEVAAQKKREIQPVNDQQVRFSTGRNGFTGMMSCNATAPVTFR